MTKHIPRLLIEAAGRAPKAALCLLTISLLFGSAALGQKSSAYYHFSLAKLHHANRDYDAAVAEFEKAIALDGEDPSLRVEFAKTLLSTGEIERAIQECSRSIELDPENVDAHYLLGHLYSREKRPESTQKALDAFRKVLELQPDHEEALMYIGQLEFSLERFEDAAETFRRVVNGHPGSVGGYYYLAQALRQLDQVDEAVRVLEDAPKQSSNVAEYWQLLGELYEQQERSDDAVDAYSRSYELSGDRNLAVRLIDLLDRLNRSAETVELLQDLVVRSPQNVSLRVRLGSALRAARRYEEAVDVLEGVVKMSEKDVRANFELAIVRWMLGYREDAMERLRFLLEITSEPFLQTVKINLALVLVDERRFDEGLQILRQLIADQPDELDLKVRYFEALLRADRTAEMLRLSKQWAGEYPQEAPAAMMRARALAANDRIEDGVAWLREHMDRAENPERFDVEMANLYLSRNQFESARQVLEEALQQNPDSRSLRFLLASTLERQEEFAAAVDQFQDLIRRNSEDAGSLNYLGYMLADRGVRLQEALGYLKRAIELDPYNGAYLDSIGWVYFRLGELKKAEEYLLKAVRINSFDSVILEHLGDLYQKLGDVRQAREYYRESVNFAEEPEELERVEKKLAGIGTGVHR